jgi:hypothetical protein
MEAGKNMMHYFISHPMTGMSTASTAVLLSWLHVISPIVAFMGVIVGFGAAVYSLMSKRKEYLINKQALHDLRVKDGIEK